MPFGTQKERPAAATARREDHEGKLMAGKRHSTLVRDDGLSIHKHRPRHDEVRPPRGYKLRADGLPGLARSPYIEVSDEDRRLLESVRVGIEMILGNAHPWTETARLGVRAAYEGLVGMPYTEDRELAAEHLLRGYLTLALTYREQARIQARVRKHRALPPTEGGPPMTGHEIVEGIPATARPRWLRTDSERKSLARAIDATEGLVNLGGKGGRAHGKTAARWATLTIKGMRAASSKR